MSRVVALVDMDCFYCQVEEKLNPDLKGLPVAVVQYNPWKGGGIIAVNYEARAQGVTRAMRGDQARELCPELVLATIPTVREKADLTRYRDAGREVLEVFCDFSECVQRASIDEAFLDITSAVQKRMPEFNQDLPPDKLANTYVVGYSTEGKNNDDERAEGTQSWLSDVFATDFHNEDDRMLAVGAVIVEEMRRAVFERTGFRCSAGIAHNKILAKLAAGLHKPNRQTVLPHSSVEQLFSCLPLRKVRNLGGKFGKELEEKLGCKFMGDLLKFSEKDLKEKFDEKTGTWLYNIVRGHDSDPVTSRLVSKSIGCCKNFPGRNALTKQNDVDRWINNLAEDFLERLLEDQTMNKRRAQQMVLNVHTYASDRSSESCSRSINLSSYSVDRIVSSAYVCLKKVCTLDEGTKTWRPPINHLGLSAGRFMDSSTTITNFFKTTDKIPEMSSSRKPSLDESVGPSFFEKEIDSMDGFDAREPTTVDRSKEGPTAVEALPKKPERPTIKSLFQASNAKSSVELSEIFPNVNDIDEDTLDLLPPSFRRKVLELKASEPQTSSSSTLQIEPNSPASSTEDIFGSSSPVHDDTERCSECGKDVKAKWFDEHKDFHFAAKLQRELNKTSVVTVVKKSVGSPKKIGSTDSLKRKVKSSLKSGGQNKKGKTSDMKIRSIDSFFKKESNSS